MRQTIIVLQKIGKVMAVLFNEGDMANTITFFRMAASIVLLFCPVFSPVFYVFYIAAGLSDMLDGFMARKTDTASELGARLDTIADFVFVAVCLIRTKEACGCSFGYEQSDRGAAVSNAADDPCCSAEILCDCRLCGGNVRRNSGRPFHQNRERIAALALQSRDWEESRP